MDPLDASDATVPARPRTVRERLLHFIWPDRPVRWRDVPRRIWPNLRQIIRLTVAAVLSYALSLPFLDGAVDLTGALTAMLVVQASTLSTIKTGFVRVVAVVTGVLVAVTLSSVVGLTWWSLAIAVSASLCLAELFRLRQQALETAISAMLILGATNHDIAGATRLGLTLVGAAVGMALNIAFPPRVSKEKSVSAVRQVAIAASDGLAAVAASMQVQPVCRADVDKWLASARAVAAKAARAGNQVAALEEARKFNPWSMGTANVGPNLRTGLESLEEAQFAVRALLVIMGKEAPIERTPDDGYGEEVRRAFAVVLDEVARCFDAYGQLIDAEAHGRVAKAESALAESLANVRETRAILTDLLLVDPQDEPSLWLMRGSILAAVDHILDGLDVGARARIRSDLENAAAAESPSLVDTLLRRDQLKSSAYDEVPPPPRVLPLHVEPDPASRTAYAARRAARRLRALRPRGRRVRGDE